MRSVSILIWIAVTVPGTNSGAATHTRIKYVAMDPRPGTIEVDVSSSVMTSVRTLEPIDDWDLGDGFHYRVARNPFDNRKITIQPLVPNPNVSSLEILSGGCWYVFELRLAREVKPISSVIFVPTELDIPGNRGNGVGESGTMVARGVDEEVAILTQLRDLPHGRPCGGGIGLDLCRQHWTLFKHFGVLRFLLSNNTGDRQVIDRIAIHDDSGTNDHTGVVSVGGGKPTKSTQIHASLAPGQSIVMAVSVRRPDHVRSTVKVALSTVGRSLPTVMTVNLDPEPEVGDGLITLSLQGIVGAVWLSNPVSPGQLIATSSTGLAARVRYGFNRRWSFEGELAGVRSASVRWSGMTFENQQGEVERDAILGRVLVGGLLHFGHRYRPLIRAGLGFRAVGYRSLFIPTTGEDQTGPGNGFAADGLYYVGLGFEAQLREHWTAGISATFVGIANRLSGEGLSGSVEAGLHVSYGWTPSITTY